MCIYNSWYRATDEVATCFNSYKTTTEEARKDERKNMMMMREEIVAMKQQLLDEIQQLEYQVYVHNNIISSNLLCNNDWYILL